MRKELDELLCSKYPKLFADRDKPMQETCMCWGFSCGDGWFDLVDQLCANIQHHIDWKEKQRGWAITHNSKADETDKRPVPEKIQQVVVQQVKEKFGTLRFYYSGGDEYIHGMVTLAESMSGRICETCGAPGKRRGQGYIYTACDEHTRESDRNDDLSE